MKELFYFFGLFALVWEILTLTKVKVVHNFCTAYDQNPVLEIDDYSIKKVLFTMFSLGYFIWITAGFFHSQWFLFVTIFLLSLVPKKNIVIRWLDAFLTSIIIVFILINEYYFKIDITDFIFSNLKL